MINRGIKKTFSLLTVLVGCGILSGCMSGDSPQPSTPVSYIAIYHASPDAPGVDVYLDTKKINTSAIPYGSYSGYLSLSTGAHELKFNEANSTTLLTEISLPLVENSFYSLYLVNELTAIDVWAIEDVPKTPASGNAEVRFVHVSPDTPSVYVTYDEETTSLFSDVTYKQTPSFKEVPAGTHTFYIKDTSTDEILLTISDQAVENAQFYTIILEGFSQPPTGGKPLDTDVVLN